MSSDGVGCADRGSCVEGPADQDAQFIGTGRSAPCRNGQWLRPRLAGSRRASRYREVDLPESAATTEPARPPHCTLRDVTDLARRTVSEWSG